MADQAQDPLGWLRSIAADQAALAEFRRLAAWQELQALTTEVRGLADAQRRTEQRIEQLVEAQARTEQRLNELAQAQARTEQRLNELAQAQARTEQRLNELAQAQARTEQRLSQLAEIVADVSADLRALAIRSDRDRGTLIELKYERHGSAYLAPLARRVRLLADDQRDDLLDDAVSAGTLTEAQADDIRHTDLLFRGRRRSDGADVLLVVEASGVVNVDDVERAASRAGLLAETGALTMPVVVGDAIAPRAEQAATRLGVWSVLNGRANPPSAA